MIPSSMAYFLNGAVPPTPTHRIPFDIVQDLSGRLMQLLPRGMQELLRIRSAGLRRAFILPGDPVLIRRRDLVRHVLHGRCYQRPRRGRRADTRDEIH
jgi:hypothetical protein